MKKQWVLLGILASILLILAGVIELASAQGPGPQARTEVQAIPLGTAFTYQGRLTDGGEAAIGEYDFQFKLYDAATEGNLLGTATVDDKAVANGLFTVELDFGEVFTGHIRHCHVCNDEIKSPWIMAESIQGFDAAGSTGHRISKPLQHQKCYINSHLFIINNKNPLFTSGKLNPWLYYRRELRLNDGKQYMKNGSLAPLAFYTDTPSIAVHNPVDNSQSHTCPFTRAFCGKVRFEDFIDDIGRNSRSCIVYRQFQVMSGS